MLRRVALVRTNVSEERANIPSSPILVTLMMEALRSSETSVLTRATRRTIPEDGVLHSHRRENLKSYIHMSNYMVKLARNYGCISIDMLFGDTYILTPPLGYNLKVLHHRYISNG
jgi:hypothetical protein